MTESVVATDDDIPIGLRGGPRHQFGVIEMMPANTFQRLIDQKETTHFARYTFAGFCVKLP